MMVSLKHFKKHVGENHGVELLLECFSANMRQNYITMKLLCLQTEYTLCLITENYVPHVVYSHFNNRCRMKALQAYAIRPNIGLGIH